MKSKSLISVRGMLICRGSRDRGLGARGKRVMGDLFLHQNEEKRNREIFEKRTKSITDFSFGLIVSVCLSACLCLVPSFSILILMRRTKIEYNTGKSLASTSQCTNTEKK